MERKPADLLHVFKDELVSVPAAPEAPGPPSCSTGLPGPDPAAAGGCLGGFRCRDAADWAAEL